VTVTTERLCTKLGMIAFTGGVQACGMQSSDVTACAMELLDRVTETVV